MLLTQVTRYLFWATSIILVSAAAAPSDVTIRTRDRPGSSSADTLRAFQRAVTEISRREVSPVFKNSTSLEKSWDGATLFSYHEKAKKSNVSITAGVDIICTSCYLKAKATAELSIDKTFNASTVFHNLTEQVSAEVKNATNTTVDWVGNYIKSTVHNFKDGIDLDDFEPPPNGPDVEFNIVIPDMPECRLKFSFDDLELYMMMDTQLSAGATYNLNLYSSNTPIGFSLSKDLELGVVFSVDLILTADAHVDIRSGFHIKIDDGAFFSLSMFADNLTDTAFKGGKFEFLPVTVQSSGGILKAVLRLGAHAGIKIETPDTGIPGLEASAGIEVGVFAHVAEFVTNITGPSTPKRNDHHDDCLLRVEESYQLAIGAAAGATVAIAGEKWGPVPQTIVPIFYTTLADACATSQPAAITTSVPTLAPRQTDGGSSSDLKTTTLTTKDVFTGVACQSPELVNCPASLQKTTKTTSTHTLVTTVPSGVKATFPPTTHNSVATTVDFGSRAKKLYETSGTPTSFNPDEPTSAVGKVIDAVNGVDKRVIIGVSVGVGSFVIITVAVGCWLCTKRRKARYQPVSRISQVHMSSADDYPPSTYDPHKTHYVATVERDGR
ncbi:hypothetical protein PG993_013585 [Apiospora rasikravindrae]|uniref:Mid2 domain-containing protein n=1 Tax=Apiospora rasikravindrae TaxID=990691 RepID=A0ABR1RY52_9PEZI